MFASLVEFHRVYALNARFYISNTPKMYVLTFQIHVICKCNEFFRKKYNQQMHGMNLKNVNFKQEKESCDETIYQVCKRVVWIIFIISDIIL